MFDEFIRKCRELGRATTTDLTDEELVGKLAKIIVSEKIHDADAFELATQAYNEGQNSGMEAI